MRPARTRGEVIPVVGRMVGAVALALVGTGGVAGPPHDTDDPETTDLGHWEIYAFAAGTGSDGGFDGRPGWT